MVTIPAKLHKGEKLTMETLVEWNINVMRDSLLSILLWLFGLRVGLLLLARGLAFSCWWHDWRWEKGRVWSVLKKEL